ncbi:iojap-like protein [Solemya velum gill symbiont]|uniref:Ribosomal silencing factor RsfS n=2 Tax=Solemya velum gill symbiont TaxID=2340 RepID=A0A0B0HDJ2_SOVGS|nr:iojap-like protein [Solemya velum gill symbiont]
MQAQAIPAKMAHNQTLETQMQAEQLRDQTIAILDDMKAMDVNVIDVRGKTSITDFMIIASGTSDRHVKSIAEAVVFKSKQAGEAPIGTEGVTDGEWALVDLNGVVVHIMHPRVRDFYQLERLWSMDPEQAEKVLQESTKQ